MLKEQTEANFIFQVQQQENLCCEYEFRTTNINLCGQENKNSAYKKPFQFRS